MLYCAKKFLKTLSVVFGFSMLCVILSTLFPCCISLMYLEGGWWDFVTFIFSCDYH
uniref:Uncharacterized protein n=1 Tax=Rhizophora mucronata TaxID=61149 RepID=A0A2P2LTF5_RHIMU